MALKDFPREFFDQDFPAAEMGQYPYVLFATGRRRKMRWWDRLRMRLQYRCDKIWWAITSGPDDDYY